MSALLASLLFPAFRGVRESAQRLACASNMRQVGLALTMYSDANERRLPDSLFSSSAISPAGPGPRELVSASLGPFRTSFLNAPEPQQAWTGLSRLLPVNAGGGYLGSASVLYSPSYRGVHTFERYAPFYESGQTSDTTQIITNYHYGGHVDFATGAKRLLIGEHGQVLMASGMRKVSEMNQADGTNVLRGDCAVTWFGDANGALKNNIKKIEQASSLQQPLLFRDVWDLLAKVK